MRGLIKVSSSDPLDLFEGVLRDFENSLGKRRNQGINAILDKESYPRLNVSQDEDRAYIEATVPGLSKEDVGVEYKDDKLCITGSAKQASKASTRQYVHHEIKSGRFERCIGLDSSIFDPDSISASMENGILTVLIEKRSEAKPQKPKQIKVK